MGPCLIGRTLVIDAPIRIDDQLSDFVAAALILVVTAFWRSRAF